MQYWEYDMNADGFVDQTVYDLDMSGTADLWHIDSIGDGFYDQIALDSNDDGYADAWMLDPNLDGVADTIWQDTNADGVADAWVYATPGTSMGWESLAAPDPYAGTTIVGGGQGDGWTIVDAYGNPVTGVGGGTMTIGPTNLSPLDQMLVNARQNGTFFDQLTIWNMIQQQNGMVDLWL